MSSNKRFIKSITATAKSATPAMPWTRGQHRIAFIAKRNAAENGEKAA